MPKKKRNKNALVVIKRAIIALLALFLVILFFMLLLPKEPDIIKGVTYDLKYPGINHYSGVSREVYENDFRLMKEAGVNTIRIYGVPPEFILDMADKYKMKVIETIVFPGDWTDFNSAYQLQALKREAIRNINRDIDRECIYAWGIWNDAPWTYGTGKGDVIRAYGPQKVNSFLREIYEAVKKRDPMRPVTAATLMVNEESMRLGADFLDILGYNAYLGITDWREGSYDEKVARDTVERLVSLSREYKKPVIITETGYSTYWKEALQKDVIKDQIRKAGNKVEGVILFQWADDWSKAGELNVQNDDIEEHWGILEGARRPKDGYYAARDAFRNSAFRRFLFGISDYFRGSYFAAKKRALRKVWKEDVIIDKEIEELQNELNLKPSSEGVPVVLDKLANKFFEKKGFDQFSSFLKEYASLYEDSAYIGLVRYYIALAGWSKLEHIAAAGMWPMYYAEKTRHLEAILDTLKKAEDETRGTREYIKALYLEWLIHNDALAGLEDPALKKLEEALKDYAKSTGDITPLLLYSKLLEEENEPQLSMKLLYEYSSYVSRFMEPSDAVALLSEKAVAELRNENYHRAKILYDAYLNAVVKNYSEEEASFAIMELANLYKRNALLDECIEACGRLVREFPAGELSDDAAYTMALALKEKKSYNRAIKAFQDFITDYPESDLARSAIKETLGIFTVYGKAASAKKTVTFLKEIIAIYPDGDFSVMARFELASSLAMLGRREEAAREYQYIIDNYPDSDYAVYSRRNIERLGTDR